MTQPNCRDVEIVAGAIALGEATEAERDAYRLHLSRCAACVETLGGEREIERTMQIVADARDAETWQPAVSQLRRRPAARFGFGWSAAAVAIALAAGGYFALPHVATVPQATVAAAPVRSLAIVRPAPKYHAVAIPQPHRPVVAVLPARKPSAQPTAVRSNAPHVTAPAVVAVRRNPGVARPPSAQSPTSADERTVADTETTSLPQQAQHAESLALLPTIVHDAVPVGGARAIVPHPARIAYYENAQGTTAIDVAVDERGVPVKCTVTKPSGYVVLDDSACIAAMRARFAPKTINGRAVPGIYRDAFTFNGGDDPQQP